MLILLTPLLFMSTVAGLNVPEWEKPWFCHGLDCPQYTVKEKTDTHELRSYKPGQVFVSSTLAHAERKCNGSIPEGCYRSRVVFAAGKSPVVADRSSDWGLLGTHAALSGICDPPLANHRPTPELSKYHANVLMGAWSVEWG
jgi:hypothetical protein